YFLTLSYFKHQAFPRLLRFARNDMIFDLFYELPKKMQIKATKPGYDLFLFWSQPGCILFIE
ncbi:MAG: hypothetical protein KBT46_06870, partial [Ruminococcus sp.]|nr:hypothetical protein [Candidatus Copronaster equi]